MNGSSDIKSKIYDILSDNDNHQRCFRFGFIETKAFKLLLVLLFYFFLYDLLKNIFYFLFTSSYYICIYHGFSYYFYYGRYFRKNCLIYSIIALSSF